MSSSRPSARPPAYHHGDLRNALLREALSADSLESMSLRQLAARLGVSAAAVYRHFDGRDALLAALAAQGFDALHRVFAEAFPIGEPPVGPRQARDRLRRLGEAYLGFATAEPALWRLMFGPLGAGHRAQARPAGRANTFDYLPAALLGLHRTGVLPQPPTDDDVRFAWSAIHGLAALRLGLVPLAQGPDDALVRAATDRLVRALGGTPEGVSATACRPQ